MAHAKNDDDCDACDDLKRISREAGGLQWGSKGRSKKPAAVSSPSSSSASSSLFTHTPTSTPSATEAHKPAAAAATHSPDDEFFSGGFWERQPPPGLAELGQAGWTLLHTIAAYYPVEADEAKQAVTYQFLRSFGKVFPCTDCARDFQRIVTEHPPRLKTRKDFVQWMCEAHNDVNAQLGKPAFPCPEALTRWRSSRLPQDK